LNLDGRVLKYYKGENEYKGEIDLHELFEGNITKKNEIGLEIKTIKKSDKTYQLKFKNNADRDRFFRNTTHIVREFRGRRQMYMKRSWNATTVLKHFQKDFKELNTPECFCNAKKLGYIPDMRGNSSKSKEVLTDVFRGQFINENGEYKMKEMKERFKLYQFMKELNGIDHRILKRPKESVVEEASVKQRRVKLRIELLTKLCDVINQDLNRLFNDMPFLRDVLCGINTMYERKLAEWKDCHRAKDYGRQILVLLTSGCFAWIASVFMNDLKNDQIYIQNTYMTVNSDTWPLLSLKSKAKREVKKGKCDWLDAWKDYRKKLSEPFDNMIARFEKSRHHAGDDQKVDEDNMHTEHSIGRRNAVTEPTAFAPAAAPGSGSKPLPLVTDSANPVSKDVLDNLEALRNMDLEHLGLDELLNLANTCGITISKVWWKMSRNLLADNLRNRIKDKLKTLHKKRRRMMRLVCATENM